VTETRKERRPEPEEGYTLLVCSRIDVLAAEPYADALLDRGIPLHVVCSAQIAEAVTERFPGLAGEPILLEELDRRTRPIRLVHNLLCALLEGESPSRNMRRRFLRERAAKSFKIRLALALGRWFPKLPAHRLNHRLGRWLGRWFANPFPTRQVLAVSHVTKPHLLCARGLDVITLNESWDHPGGKCAGYPSRAVIAWNADVADDWQRFQGAEETWVGIPVKLAYAYESPPLASTVERVAMYAVGASTTMPDWYDEEQALIEALCVATREAGWKLVVKPRPSGPQPGLDDFASRHPHVAVARTTSSLGARDYYLDDEYNRQRLEQLAECSLVINTMTTFCLDAVCAGVPVIQLDLRGSDAYPSLGIAQRNYHLERYLLGDEALCLRPPVGESLVETLAGFLSDPDNRPFDFRDRIRSWIVPGVPSERRIAEVVEHLISRLSP